jgi:hypothetical protein
MELMVTRTAKYEQSCGLDKLQVETKLPEGTDVQDAKRAKVEYFLRLN